MAHEQLTGAMFAQMLAAGTDYLERNKQIVDSLNVFPVPDGDTGTNMTLTLSAARRDLGDADELSLGEVTKRIARGVLLGARGNSGVILSQFLRGFATGLSDKTTAGPKDVAEALAKATDTAYRAVIKPVEGTMLTVGKGASEHARRAASAGADLCGVFEAAVQGAEQALARTPDLLPVLAKAGVVDAGGQGLVYFLTGALSAMRGEAPAPVQAPPETSSMQSVQTTITHGAITHEVVNFCYCTEFLIRGDDIPRDVVQDRIGQLGDSLLVIGDDDLVKVHVHTDNPGKALEIGLEYGELLEISIDNMQEQNRRAASTVVGNAASTAAGSNASTAAGSNASTAAGNGSVIADAVRNGATSEAVTGVVAVAPGDGWEELLTSLGVARVVRGGQTMNPSAAELVEAIEAVDADDVIIMPNNSNVVFAAGQARELTSKRVHVIETTSAPQSVAAMMAYNPEGSPETVAAEMAEAAEELRVAEVTYAVRDSDAFDDGIKAGDTLAIIDGDISIVGDNPEDIAVLAVERLMDDDASLVSIYYGADVDAAAAESLAERIARQWPDCDVEVYDGGQPVYYYILSVE